jgi:hypothetical protein
LHCTQDIGLYQMEHHSQKLFPVQSCQKI